MAESRPIHVSVIEGEFASLKALGIPIATRWVYFLEKLCGQPSNLRLDSLSASSGQSHIKVHEKSNSSRSKRKTKKRKNNKKRELLKSPENQDTSPSKMLEVQKPVVIEEPSPPNDAHQVQAESASGTGENVKSPEEKLRKIDLANCKEVAYEMRDGMPGVRYKEET